MGNIDSLRKRGVEGRRKKIERKAPMRYIMI